MPLFKKAEQVEEAEIRPIAPEPEAYVGENLPYRGVQPHGVPMEQDFVDLDEEAEEVNPPVEYETPSEPPEPVPVRIIQEFRKELKRWRTTQWGVGNMPVMVAGRSSTRRRIIVSNPTPERVVYVGHAPHLANATYGWELGISTVTTGTNDNTPKTDILTTQTNQTTGGTSAAVFLETGWTDLVIGLSITSLTGTTPNVTVKVQQSIDNVNWSDLVSFTAATAATYEVKNVNGPASNILRVVWTVNSGTVTDLDFEVRAMRFPGIPASTTSTSTRNAPTTLELWTEDEVWLARASTTVISYQVLEEYVIDETD